MHQSGQNLLGRRGGRYANVIWAVACCINLKSSIHMIYLNRTERTKVSAIKVSNGVYRNHTPNQDSLKIKNINYKV